MESCTKDNVMLCLVGCLQCRRCILQTPIDSKRSTHHRDAPQHSMLATAWINYKNTASYFQLSLSSNGIAGEGHRGDAVRYVSRTIVTGRCTVLLIPVRCAHDAAAAAQLHNLFVSYRHAPSMALSSRRHLLNGLLDHPSGEPQPRSQPSLPARATSSPADSECE